MKVKIYISYHKAVKLFKSEILQPIYAGANLASFISKEINSVDSDWLLKNTLPDNEGDNISSLNRFFCEMTTIYWAWKNQESQGYPDYIGHMLYRKHLNFKKLTTSSIERTPGLERFPEKYQSEYGFNDSDILRVLKDTHKAAYFCAPVKNNISVYDQWVQTDPKFGLDTKILDYAINYILKNHQQYASACNKYFNGFEHYWGNCFLMRRDIFERYCEFVFDVLFSIYKNFDISKKNIAGARVVGHVAERLLGVFITKLKEENEDIIYAIPTLTKDASEKQVISPVAATKQAIMYSIDSNYAKYCAVSIRSLLANRDNSIPLDIVVVHQNVQEYILRKIKLCEEQSVNIRFFNINDIVSKEELETLPTKKYWSLATYFRFFVGDIFSEYERVLYLDSDTIVCDSIDQILNVSLKQDEVLAACIDIGMMRYLQDANWQFYARNKLKINNLENYFQAAVILFDIKKYNAEEFRSRLLSSSASNDYKYLDQDALNVVFQNRVKLLDLRWNLPWSLKAFYMNEVRDMLSIKHADTYLKSFDHPGIIHFCNVKKPWTHVSFENAHLFWKYAKMTCFYEEILLASIRK